MTTYVVQCEYVAWVTRRRYRFIQVRCPLFDEVLFTLWDHYITCLHLEDLTPSHTLVTEQFCLLYHAVLPERNRERLLDEFATIKGGEGERALLQHRQLHSIY